MRQRLAYWSGVLLVVAAVAAVPSGAVVTSYVGGSAVAGRVEDGRYFVDPRHGQPRVEVTERTWRTVYWVERLWPFSVLVPLFAGLFLTTSGTGPSGSPMAAPPKELRPWALWACPPGSRSA